MTTINKKLWGLGIGDWGLGPIPNPQLFNNKSINQ